MCHRVVHDVYSYISRGSRPLSFFLQRDFPINDLYYTYYIWYLWHQKIPRISNFTTKLARHNYLTAYVVRKRNIFLFFLFRFFALVETFFSHGEKNFFLHFSNENISKKNIFLKFLPKRTFFIDLGWRSSKFFFTKR